jgi:hypothetical protein
MKSDNYKKRITLDDGYFVFAAVFLCSDGIPIERKDHKFFLLLFGKQIAFKRAHKWADKTIELLIKNEVIS